MVFLCSEHPIKIKAACQGNSHFIQITNVTSGTSPTEMGEKDENSVGLHGILHQVGLCIVCMTRKMPFQI